MAGLPLSRPLHWGHHHPVFFASDPWLRRQFAKRGVTASKKYLIPLDSSQKETVRDAAPCQCPWAWLPRPFPLPFYFYRQETFALLLFENLQSKHENFQS